MTATLKKTVFLVVLLGVSALVTLAQHPIKPIISARNFESQADLWNALGKGIYNYQADVMYIYGKNFVTPVMPDSVNHRAPTLRDAYLYPLYNQFKKNNGEFVAGYQNDIFLILNFTAQPVQAYKQLIQDLRPFMEMLSYVDEGKMHPGKLRILVKDKQQYEALKTIKPDLLGLTGDKTDIGKSTDPTEMPLIEVFFSELTSWKGTGNIPFEDFMKLKDLVTKVHSFRQKISFRNCPPYKSVAEVMLTIKADFMNTTDAFQLSEQLDSVK